MDKDTTAYLSRQLIAYIGNKRRLLPFLSEIFQRLREEGCQTFFDPFAGSGAVSRLARTLGFSVTAGDWEFYSYLVNAAHVGMNRADGEELFQNRGGLEAVLEELNRRGREGSRGEGYISRHYAPADTLRADFRRERLFYTRENALFLDTVRDAIEDWYPRWGGLRPPEAWDRRDGISPLFSEPPLPDRWLREKILLTAQLVYQGATRANTSGVFKAFHKGFGGHGGDALTRIMSPLSLERPVLTDAGEGRAVWMGADEFATSFSGDLYYLDPPYNIHQYGSNYHMLNSLALWDKPPVDERRREDGTLRSKGGIRPDWIRTRSPFCSPRSAAKAMGSLLDKIDTRFIVLSYSTDGIIPFEEMYDLLSRRGEVEVCGTDYVKYRGGKQSLGRKNQNVEFQWILRCGPSASSRSRVRAERFLLEHRLLTLFGQGFVPERLFELFRIPIPLQLSLEDRNRDLDGGTPGTASEPGVLVWTPREGPPLELPHRRGYRFLRVPAREELSPYSNAALRELEAGLTRALCRDQEEEAEILLCLLKEGLSGPERRYLTRRFLIALRKLAHKKNRPVFSRLMDRAIETAPYLPEGEEELSTALKELDRIARLRFDG